MDPQKPIDLSGGDVSEADLGAGDVDQPTPTKQPTFQMQGGMIPTFPQGITPFAKEVGEAAGKDISGAWQGIKTGAKENLRLLREDPSRIVPMWFGGLMNAGEAFAKAVATPAEYAFQGDIPSAISSAAGGDPTAAQAYKDQGNSGGEFWEMIGKPLALIATGKALGSVGGSVAEGASESRLRIVRSVMSDANKTGIGMDEAKLAQQALQDAARADFGTGPAGFKKLKKATPGMDKGFTDLLSGNPATKSRVEAGNTRILDLSRKAVDIAGEPADEVNRVYGYMDGRQQARNIAADLRAQAASVKLPGRQAALEKAAKLAENEKTLGGLYDLKKEANKVGNFPSTTQEQFDELDAMTELSAAIRKEVYPIYDQQVSHASMPGFSLSEAGRKEGAAMQFRNGLERRYAASQRATDELHTSGHALSQASHGAGEHRTILGATTRKAQQMGLLPSPQGELNKDVRRAVGKLSPGTVPESLRLETPARFGPNPPTIGRLLPGGTYQFHIPTTTTTEGFNTSSLTHKAAPIPESHTFPSWGPTGYMHSVAEGSLPVREDIARGGGTIITDDPVHAQKTLESLEYAAKHPNFKKLPVAQQKEISQGIASLKQQLAEYQKGVGKPSISHTPPKVTATQRKTGRIPVSHKIRASAPAVIADIDREEDEQ